MRPSPPSRLAIGLIRVYQATVSPLLGRHCRYLPTCSQYAEEAISQKGLLKGACLSARRVLRCHPFAKGGYDPVDGPRDRHS